MCQSFQCSCLMVVWCSCPRLYTRDGFARLATTTTANSLLKIPILYTIHNRILVALPPLVNVRPRTTTIAFDANECNHYPGAHRRCLRTSTPRSPSSLTRRDGIHALQARARPLLRTPRAKSCIKNMLGVLRSEAQDGVYGATARSMARLHKEA